jgi:hypothetical protein
MTRGFLRQRTAGAESLLLIMHRPAALSIQDFRCPSFIGPAACDRGSTPISVLCFGGMKEGKIYGPFGGRAVHGRKDGLTPSAQRAVNFLRKRIAGWVNANAPRRIGMRRWRYKIGVTDVIVGNHRDDDRAGHAAVAAVDRSIVLPTAPFPDFCRYGQTRQRGISQTLGVSLHPCCGRKCRSEHTHSC